MNNQLDTKRITLYIVFAYGISWAVALVILLRGGLANSPEIAPGFTEALLLTAVGYMVAPAIAHVLTRLLTREGWQDTALRPHFRKGRRYWLVAWLGTPALLIAGAAVYFILFPANFDGSLSFAAQILADLEAQAGETVPFTPASLAVVQIIQAIILGPILNAIPIFGEEFGWRAYLQPKLMPLGWRKAMIWMGVIWGVWHWPLVAMGHGFGLDYPGAPWTGLLVFTWFTFVVGIFFGWLTLKGRSVWPAVIGHGALNGLAPAAVIFVQGSPNPLVGPTAAGLVAGIGFSVVGLWLLLREAPAPVGEMALQGAEG